MKKHLKGTNGRALCGAQVEKFVEDNNLATCNGCRGRVGLGQAEKSGEPDWSRKCMVCGQKPILRETGMCGPCTFGEADTAGGNW